MILPPGLTVEAMRKSWLSMSSQKLYRSTNRNIKETVREIQILHVLLNKLDIAHIKRSRLTPRLPSIQNISPSSVAKTRSFLKSLRL